MTLLEELVLRKITEAQFYPYGIRYLLEMSMIVFSRRDFSTKSRWGRKTESVTGKGRDDSEGIDDESKRDKLEDWLIENLIEKLQAVLLNHAQLFFQVANAGACKKRGFGVRIFRGKVEEWERNGPDVVAIEDDE
jgi:hypothetical protein